MPKGVAVVVEGVKIVSGKAALRNKDKAVNALTVKMVLEEALSIVSDFSKRFIIPDDFMPDHPERHKIVAYLQGRAFRGTESGGAMQAGVSLSKIAQWRADNDELAPMEAFADQTCTDSVEEMLLMQARVTGDKEAIQRALKGRRSNVYGDKQEVTGRNGGPVEFNISFGGVPRPKRIRDGT